MNLKDLRGKTRHPDFAEISTVFLNMSKYVKAMR
jgi:hypothetical protein